MNRRPIDPVDATWLRMDRPENLMVIESLMVLGGPLDVHRFKGVLKRRLVEEYPVFHQHPVESRVPMRPAQWEDDPDFSLDRHIFEHRLAAPGGDAELQAFIDDHLSRPLRRDRPLWEMHVLSGYGEGTAVYSRLHHSLADGIALTRVLLSMTDAEPDGDGFDRVPQARSTHTLLGRAAHLAAMAGSSALDAARLLEPWHLAHTAALALQTTEVAGKLLLTTLKPSPISGPPQPPKRAVWAPAIPLAPVVEAAHRSGTTVNDVMMAALAGAVATYVRDHGGDPVDVTTMVPVNVRPLDKPLPRELGNRFALVLFTLPSASATPFERLAETKRRMDAIKHSPEALVTFGLIQGIGLTGEDIEPPLVDFFANKASGVTTNVPGPRDLRYVAGTPITALLGWVPSSGHQTLGTSIFTYHGQVFVGFKVDAGVIAHPEQLVTAFLAEVDTLCALAPEAATAKPRRASASRASSKASSKKTHA